MIAYESREVRRLVGRLERGESLLDAFADLARHHRVKVASIRAIGALEAVTLVEYNQQRQQYEQARTFECPTEILSLQGNLSIRDGEPFAHLHATVSRETDNGIQVLGGHVIRARVFACEFVVECFDDLVLERQFDPDTGLLLWPARGAERRQVSAAVASNSVSWDQAVAASATSSSPRRATPPVRSASSAESSSFASAFVPDPIPERKRPSGGEFLDEPMPQPGDYVDHRQFGTCRVDGEDPDGGLIIRLPSGVRKTIRLDFFEVQGPRYDGDQQIYALLPRRR